MRLSAFYPSIQSTGTYRYYHYELCMYACIHALTTAHQIHITGTRKDGTKATTRVKKIVGDRDLFVQEMRSALQLPLDSPVRIRVGGTIEVDGNRSREVREWLAGLGF